MVISSKIFSINELVASLLSRSLNSSHESIRINSDINDSTFALLYFQAQRL